ncbi:unnamed protein product [Arabidopsis thaliana]|uniref:Bet v I/Major latex protein domain-containing protein n=1 Tax=Arabidopsis thaliana TaxID=3702 RepID=A0A5S9VSL6_ARATH|nr:unnamed protein product [Arabidopsis thaliana]
MTLKGALSVKFDVKCPADKFFSAFVEDTNRPFEKNGKTEIEAVDLVKKTMTIQMSGSEIQKYFKTLKGSIAVTPIKGGDARIGEEKNQTQAVIGYEEEEAAKSSLPDVILKRIHRLGQIDNPTQIKPNKQQAQAQTTQNSPQLQRSSPPAEEDKDKSKLGLDQVTKTRSCAVKDSVVLQNRFECLGSIET